MFLPRVCCNQLLQMLDLHHRLANVVLELEGNFRSYLCLQCCTQGLQNLLVGCMHLTKIAQHLHLGG